MLSRSRKHSLVASVGRSQLDDQRQQRPTISANILNSYYYRSLNTRTSIVSQVVFTYQYFYGTQYTQHNTRFVYIVDIFGQNTLILLQYLSYYLELLLDFTIYINLVALLLDRPDFPSFQFQIAFREGPRLVLARRLNRSFYRRSATSDTERERRYELDSNRLPEI